VIAYIDSSVLLRVILGQRGQFAGWKSIRVAVASSLVEVECLRTLDRLHKRGLIDSAECARRRESVYRLMEEMKVVEPTRVVLDRASQPFPTAIGTLDAIHLTTALLWREREHGDLVMATHDSALGLAARSCGLSVGGL